MVICIISNYAIEVDILGSLSLKQILIFREFDS